MVRLNGGEKWGFSGQNFKNRDAAFYPRNGISTGNEIMAYMQKPDRKTPCPAKQPKQLPVFDDKSIEDCG